MIKLFRTTALAGALGLAVAAGAVGPALAQSAPTHLAVDNTTAQSTNFTSLGNCPAGQVAIFFLGNTAGKAQQTFTDSQGNTWNASPTEAIQGSMHLRAFKAVVATGKDITTSTTFQYTLASAGGGSVIAGDCWPSGTAVDGEHVDNGAASTFGTITTTSHAPTNNTQMIGALFLSNQWPSITPQPPTSSGAWAAGATGITGTTFGIKTWYLNVNAGATATIGPESGTSSTTWTALFEGVDYGAPPPTHGNSNGLLLGVGR